MGRGLFREGKRGLHCGPFIRVPFPRLPEGDSLVPQVTARGGHLPPSPPAPVLLQGGRGRGTGGAFLPPCWGSILIPRESRGRAGSPSGISQAGLAELQQQNKEEEEEGLPHWPERRSLH